MIVIARLGKFFFQDGSHFYYQRNPDGSYAMMFEMANGKQLVFRDGLNDDEVLELCTHLRSAFNKHGFLILS